MNDLRIQSHQGSYPVHFGTPFEGLKEGLPRNEHLIIDAKVAALHSEVLKEALSGHSVLKIEAVEENKSLEKMPEYIWGLLKGEVKRGDVLVAVGGGIVQDIVAFLAAILFRGLAWRIYPTTLLSQADSCIGSKSSINVAGYKNQVGTFTPPQSIHISTDILETLTDADFRSGLGEIIKVHLIAGQKDFQWIGKNYPLLRKDKVLLMQAIRRSLEIKKGFVEKDEFDRKDRLFLNYGHSFGHAIESATQYAIPHGIAITLGMDVANYFSWKSGFITKSVFDEIHLLLAQNYRGFESQKMPLDRFFSAISRDKKNVGSNLSLVLTRGPGKVFKMHLSNDTRFQSLCREYLETIWV